MSEKELRALAHRVDDALAGMDTTSIRRGSACARRIAWALGAAPPKMREEIIERMQAGA